MCTGSQRYAAFSQVHGKREAWERRKGGLYLIGTLRAVLGVWDGAVR